MALKLAQKAAEKNLQNPVVGLYRSMAKEVPKVLSIFDIDMAPADARAKIRSYFTANAHVKDERVKEILIAKGYMELEETLMQWKQKAQLMRIFEGVENKWREEVSVESEVPKTVTEEFEAIKNKVDTNDYGFENAGREQGVVQQVGKGGVRVL
ncbi:hypothetical protein TrCOL_g12158 [Triparma columacea]|uniref:Uncharacterized protein n=1 Tax=Triparma columacea TaxID=722753 RepID=A0A9W7G0H6_9STRA|nr:hypothetical protein TrCOL_g12158 [Triparma columacea]